MELCFFGLAVDTSLKKNPTTDEPVHVTRITLWQQGDYRFQQEHTPLSHWLNGLLTMTEPLPDVTTLDGWAESDRLRVSRDLIWQSGLSVERLFFLARLPLVLLGVLCGAVLLNWSWALGQREAYWLTAVFFPFAPNLLAHASLATTDFAATAGYLFVLFSVWRHQQRPTWTRYIVVGLLIGLALTAKMTSLLIWPLILIILYNDAQQSESPDLWRPLQRWLGWFPIAGVVVLTLYQFTIGEVYIPQLDWTLSLPAPAYWRSLLGVSGHIDGGHRAFFLGTISDQGWWHYFTVALWLKTPLLLLFGTVCAVLWSIAHQRWRKTVYLWLPIVALYVAATLSRLNIGYRHILPLVPFLHLWSAISLAEIWRHHGNGRSGRLLTVGLLAYAGFALYIHPHHLSYFNLLVGGPANGGAYLGDSNLDWGQDWQAVSLYIQENNLADPYIAPFGFIDPAYYGLDGPRVVLDSGFANEAFSPANPSAGTYFLSTNAYQGMLAQPDLLDWFRRETAVNRRATGYSIRQYEVSAKATGEWVAHCAAPAPLLEPEAAEQLVNGEQLRHLYFDCTQSWVIPQIGTAGWYILPPDAPPTWPLTRFAPHLREVYAHEATVFAPSYRVYYWDGDETGLEALFNVSAEDSQTVGGVARLVGYTAEPAQWRTIWQVEQSNELPLSFFAHLYPQAAEPVPPFTADGLGYSTVHWQPGDVMVQTHLFESAVSDIDRFETGAYNYATQERLLTDEGETAVIITE